MDEINFFDIFSSDESSETEGTWLDYGDFRIKIAYAGGANEAYSKTLAQVFKPHKQSLEFMSEKKARELLSIVFSKTIVKGWEGIKDPKTKQEIPFSEKKAHEFLCTMPKFFEFVKKQSANAEHYRVAELEESAKNS